jgi:L-alanine-DL-glutamate epimerase-like enolase superfamily enzyme
MTPFALARLDTFRLRVPFDDLRGGPRAAPAGWTEFDMVLVRATAADGTVGWGEAFAYGCAGAVKAALDEMVAPLALGRRIDDLAAFARELQFRLHIQGRYGITLFALSGLDIALWDIAAKRAGTPLSALIGAGGRRDAVAAYASLVRYANPAAVAAVAARAGSEGYAAIKLHEIAYDCIAAGSAAAGRGARVMTDVNGAWRRDEAEAILPRLAALGLHWVEEPIFPPEDDATLAALGRFGVPIAAGENACTEFEFRRLARAVAICQPSVIKVGGVSEFVAAAAACRNAGARVVPHSPYFGPGYWATLHLAAALPGIDLFEYLYVRPAAFVAREIPLPRRGVLAVPTAPGLGFEPDSAVLDRFRVP